MWNIVNNKQKQGKGHLLDLAHAAKVSERKYFKILTLQQMLQRLPIAIAQVKAGNTSKSLINETHQIIYFLYQAKKIPKEVYDIIMNSIKL